MSSPHPSSIPAPTAPTATEAVGASSLRLLGITIAFLFGLWATLAQVVIVIGLAWVIPAFAMAGRTGRPWYNVMNWLWGLGPFALLILGRPRKPYPTLGAMVRDNTAASVLVGLVGGLLFLTLLSTMGQLV